MDINKYADNFHRASIPTLLPFGFLPFLITANTMDSDTVFTTLQTRCFNCHRLFCVLLLHFISCQTLHCVTIFYKSTKQLNKKKWNTNVFGATGKDGLNPIPTEKARRNSLRIFFLLMSPQPFTECDPSGWKNRTNTTQISTNILWVWFFKGNLQRSQRDSVNRKPPCGVVWVSWVLHLEHSHTAACPSAFTYASLTLRSIFEQLM